jgi:hypothetical protein
MRTSLTGSLFLLVGAGAAAVAAAGLDFNGNNLQLNGSDTLFEVTQDVLGACPGAFMRTISYLGGGSGVGVIQQQLNNQRVSPSSRSFKSTEYCTPGTTTNPGGPPTNPANTEALLVGVDGISVVGNRTTATCSSGAANGFGSPSFPVPGQPDYVPADSFEVLKLLYFGLHNGTGGSTADAYDCGSPQRRALVANWRNLFAIDCGFGDNTCPNGLTHAWRPADVTGTADAFVRILNPPHRTIGTFSNVPTDKQRRQNPFCNSHDANFNTASYVDEGTPTALSGATFYSAADMQDEDPVRVASFTNFATTITGDTVSRGRFGTPAFAGSLGVVLPILPPDAPAITLSDAYPQVNCSTSCDLVPIIRSTQIPAGFICPDGQAPVLGGCLQPVISSSHNPDPRCIASNTTRCFGVPGSPDGRAYNLATIVLASQIPAANRQAGAVYQFALDANKRIMAGSFYRIHMRKPAPNAAPDTSLGQTGICREADATGQIGCLVDADRCSLGVAGRGAAKNFPGLGGPPVPTPAPLKALALSAPGIASTPPFTPGPDPDLAVRNLLSAPGTTPFYPMARRLWLHTLYGFGDSQLFTDNNADFKSGERELVKCFNNASLTTAAIVDNGYVPHTTGSGAIECVDYPEQKVSMVLPPPNVQGTGAVAFPGCDNGTFTGHDACADPATAP